MAAAVSMPIIFGDERDAIIAKWNQMQAFWGVGKGYYSQQGAPVAFTPDNPFCRFKAVGYNCLPKSKNEDGLLGIVFKKKHSEVSQVQQAIVDKLGQLMGSKPTLSVHVENTVTLPDDQTELIIYVVERQPTGVSRRIPSTELYAFMNQANIKTQLGQMEVVNILPKTGFTAEQLKFYLDNPPAGIDPLLWQQAKLDNPDPESLIPVPMKGFKELHDRLKFQERQTKLHQSRLDLIGQDITEQQRNLANMVARTEQYKRKHLELGHRVLQVMVRQEIYRKLGYAIQADEEQLRVQLEALQGELNAPTQFKGRLNELMSQIRMQNQLVTSRSEANYQLDTAMQLEIRQHLKQQQEGLQHLISIIKDDMEDLKLIEQGLVVDVKQQKR
ncbi:nucleoporin p54 [Lingula anatina]|nr:nucleoporin p54 [Lingula anatina]|eukprot:XP_013380711.1 nucleoporin p54 [Lingula anatina]